MLISFRRQANPALNSSPLDVFIFKFDQGTAHINRQGWKKRIWLQEKKKKAFYSLLASMGDIPIILRFTLLFSF